MIMGVNGTHLALYCAVNVLFYLESVPVGLDYNVNNIVASS